MRPELIKDQNLGYLESPLDEVPLHRRWERNFDTDFQSMSHSNPSRGIPDPRGLNIYTDGSKDNHQTGAGVAILKDGEVPVDTDGNEKIYSYHLTERTTVFQSEVFAQKMAATLIINGSFGPGKWVNKNTDITINSDNQASIRALSKVWVKSKLVKETLDLLD